jgi:hypothetical protein
VLLPTLVLCLLPCPRAEAVNEKEEAAAAGPSASITATPAASPQRQQPQQLLQGSYSPGLTNELLPATPLSLEELESKMLSSATKAMFAKEMPEVDIGSDGEFSFDNIKYSSNTGGCGAVCCRSSLVWLQVLLAATPISLQCCHSNVDDVAASAQWLDKHHRHAKQALCSAVCLPGDPACTAVHAGIQIIHLQLHTV